LLGKIDPVLAEKLHPNDLKRVIRGLEVYEITNRRLSDFQKESRHRSPFEVLYIGLNFKDRSLLYDRINLRVDQMVEKGLIEEVRNLMENYQLSDTARAGIGYKELIDAIESGGDIELALDLIKQKSRNYAKRQLTWFGRNKDVHWFYRDQMSDEALLQNAIDLADKFLKGGNE
jgi:tRNA dimethylallyltransferase